MAVATMQLPAGTVFRPLEAHADERGVFTELYRVEWGTGVEPVQWNAVWSEAGVLRGVHVHLRHDDYLTVPVGRASVGLRDLRRGSPTEGLTALVELGPERPAALEIKHGVAHGFYFHEPSLHVYAVSEYWDPADELGCDWADPELGIPWPAATARVSDLACRGGYWLVSIRAAGGRCRPVDRPVCQARGHALHSLRDAGG